MIKGKGKTEKAEIKYYLPKGYIRTSKKEPEPEGEILAFYHSGFFSMFQILVWDETLKAWKEKYTGEIEEKLKDNEGDIYKFRMWMRLDAKEMLDLQDWG